MPSNIQTITFQYQLHNDLQRVPSHWHALIDSAQQITEQAYAPYSRFKVGAAVLLDNGVIVRVRLFVWVGYPCLTLKVGGIRV